MQTKVPSVLSVASNELLLIQFLSCAKATLHKESIEYQHWVLYGVDQSCAVTIKERYREGKVIFAHSLPTLDNLVGNEGMGRRRMSTAN